MTWHRQQPGWNLSKGGSWADRVRRADWRRLLLGGGTEAVWLAMDSSPTSLFLTIKGHY